VDVVALEQCLRGEVVERALDPGLLGLELGAVFLGRHLPQFGEPADVVLEPHEAIDHAPQTGCLLAERPGLVRVAPETRVVEERVEFAQPGLGTSEVKDTPEG
jgi:hypothetical protein